MPVFSRDGRVILYIHIPKSGGSSIEKVAKEAGWSESFSVRGKSLKELTYYKATLQHLHADILNMLFNLEEFDSIFTVVRNPFSRLKSEYYWQRSQRITRLGVDEWIDDTFTKYKKNNFIYDNHIRPQVEFVPKCNHVEIFKLEENAIEKTKHLFSKLTPKTSQCDLLKRSLIAKFSGNIIQEKKSVKDPEVEAKFQIYHSDIVDLYKEDFAFFSYEI